MNLYRVSQKTHFQNCHQLASNCQNHCHQKFGGNSGSSECAFFGTPCTYIHHQNQHQQVSAVGSSKKWKRRCLTGLAGCGVAPAGGGWADYRQDGHLETASILHVNQIWTLWPNNSSRSNNDCAEPLSVCDKDNDVAGKYWHKPIVLNVENSWYFLICIWHYKILSVYWTSTVHWLDLQITRFQSIAISAFRRSSRRVYFLLVGLADHWGPTSMSPCIGKNLLSSIEHNCWNSWLIWEPSQLPAVGNLSGRCNNCWKQREPSLQCCFNILIVFFRSAPVSAFPAAVCTIAAPQL